MPSITEGPVLADSRYVTLVLRLLIDRQGRLVHGEIVDVDGRTRGRFSEWRDLLKSVRKHSAIRTPEKSVNATSEPR